MDCLIVGINCFDNGVERDGVLACFDGKIVEMRVFFFEGKFLLYLVVIVVDMFQWKQEFSGVL